MNRCLFLAALSWAAGGSIALSASPATHMNGLSDPRCQDATTAAASLTTQKTTDEATLRGLTRPPSSSDGQLALVAAINVEGPCSRGIDWADLTTMHLPSGALLTLDSDNRPIVHPGGYSPSAPDRATVPHPAIPGERFVMAVPVSPANGRGNAQYVAIYSTEHASRLYQYALDAHQQPGESRPLLTSDTALLSISVLPDVDTPAQSLYVLQAQPNARRLLIYRWTRSP